MDEASKPEFTIDGTKVVDIASFYAEINRVFMADEDWEIGESLDALNDLLHGGIGALFEATEATVRWESHEVSRAALGKDATVAYYQHKIDRPETYAAAPAAEAVAALREGTGRTYFDLVLEVFREHPHIALVLA